MQKIQRKIDRADHAQGPYPILESLQPRYREHKVEGWEGLDEIEVEETEDEQVYDREVVQETGFWSTPIEQEYVEHEEDNPSEPSLW